MRIRRTDHELRVEIMPLIDVIFLLLTFFIYAMVLLRRVDMLPMELPQLASAGPDAVPPAALTISLDAAGRWYVDRQPIELDALPTRLAEAKQAEPDVVIYLAVDAVGQIDRLPAFLDLHDRLAGTGIELRVVGKPLEAPPSP